MKILNGFLPRTKTSTSIDKETKSIYQDRHSGLTGTFYAEEDTTPPLLPKNFATTKFKKITHWSLHHSTNLSIFAAHLSFVYLFIAFIQKIDSKYGKNHFSK